MDLNILLQALTAADQASAESNPFSPFKSAADGVGAALLKNASNFSPTENLWGGLATGLISGVAGNFEDTYKDKQNALASDLIGKALTGQSVFERPEGMPPSVFANLNNTGKLVRLADQIEQQKAARDAQLGFQNEIAKKGLDIVAGNNPIQAEEKLNSLKKYLTGQGTTTPAIEPGSREDYLQKAGGDEQRAKTLFERDLTAPDRLSTLRKEFSDRPEIKNFIVADTGFKSMMKAYQDKTGTSDLELTRGGIQAIEPGLAVRTDDYAQIAQSSSLPDAWKANILGVLAGTSRLSDDVRNGLVRIAARRYNEYGAKFSTALDFYKQRASEEKVNPDGISYLGFQPNYEMERLGLDENGNPVKTATNGAAQPSSGVKLTQITPGRAVDQQGQQWIKVQGGWQKAGG